MEHDLIGKPVSTFPDHALGRGTRELRRQIAAERHWADMAQRAPQIGPDFAAHVGPSLAESEILTEIGSILGNHRLEKRKPLVARRAVLDRMIALVLKLRMTGAHRLQRAAPDHEKSGAGVAHLDEARPFGHRVRVLDLEHVAQGGRRNRDWRLRCFAASAPNRCA